MDSNGTQASTSDNIDYSAFSKDDGTQDLEKLSNRLCDAYDLRASNPSPENNQTFNTEEQEVKDLMNKLRIYSHDNGRQKVELSPQGELKIAESTVRKGVKAARRAAKKAKKDRRNATIADRGAKERQQQVLDKIATGVLPKELIVLVCEFVVGRSLAHLTLESEHTLPQACEEILGSSPSAQKLQPLLEQVALERSRIRLDIPFIRRTGGGDPIAQKPPFVEGLLHPIRHVEIVCRVDVPRARLVYPITIFRLIRGAASIKDAFPTLQSFTILLDLIVDDEVRGIVDTTLDRRCFCGYTATTTYRDLICKMLHAIYYAGPGRQKRLKLSIELQHIDKRWEGEEVDIQPTSTEKRGRVDDDSVAALSMAHLLETASRVKLLEKPKKQQVPNVESPAYSERSNDNMRMLEDETDTVNFAGDGSD